MHAQRNILGPNDNCAHDGSVLLPWDKIKAAVEDAIGDVTLSYPSSDGVRDQYQGIYEKIQHSLANVSKLHSRRATDGIG